MTEVTKVQLESIARIQQGRYLSPDDMTPLQDGNHQIPVWGANGVLGYTSATSEIEAVALVTCRGNGCGLLQWTAGPAHISNNAMAVTPLTGRTDDRRFLYYSLRAEEFGDVTTGSAQPQITAGNLKTKKIWWSPSAEARKAIGEMLGVLDDKIESNRRLGDTGIDLARTMLLKGETRARLGDIATCDKGLSYKGDCLVEDSDLGLPMINLGNFATSGWLMPDKLKFYKGEYKDRHLVKPGDVVVANTDLTQQRVIIGRPALVPPTLGNAIFTHHVTAVRPVTDESLRLPIWSQLNSQLFRERAEGFATGTTVAGMPVETLLDFEIEVPNRTVIEEAQAVLERVWIAELESSKLALVRDALLPELLSGRLRVGDAEKMVEGAM